MLTWVQKISSFPLRKKKEKCKWSKEKVVVVLHTLPFPCFTFIEKILSFSRHRPHPAPTRTRQTKLPMATVGGIATLPYNQVIVKDATAGEWKCHSPHYCRSSGRTSTFLLPSKSEWNCEWVVRQWPKARECPFRRLTTHFATFSFMDGSVI